MKCGYCGKKIPKGRSKFCTDECRILFFRKLNRKNKVCEICGKNLTGRQMKYCGSECQKIAEGKKQRFCEICGKPLTGNQMCFCGKECFEKAKAAGRYTYPPKAKDKYDKDKYKKPKAEPKKKGRPKKVPSIAEVNERAKALGLSYGQYVAMCSL